MSSATVGELRERLSEYLSRVQFGGERVSVTRHGKAVAALISQDDLELLRALEDRLDNDEADEVLREVADTDFVPWERVRADAP